MNSRGRSLMSYYTIGISALFFAGIFLLVLFAASNYRQTVAGQQGNMKKREMLSYISTVIAACDRSGAVGIEESSFGPMLTIRDVTDQYAFRIYCKDGRLLEDYGKEEAALNPEGARVIGETEVFRIEKLSDRLLAVHTDAGRVLIHLKSQGGLL